MIVHGGIQIAGVKTTVSSSYDGVRIDHVGSKLEGGRWVTAGSSIEMNAFDALDLAASLIRAAQKHGSDCHRAAEVLIKRIGKRPSGS